MGWPYNSDSEGEPQGKSTFKPTGAAGLLDKGGLVAGSDAEEIIADVVFTTGPGPEAAGKKVK
ncbi:MAG: hypothetical protein ACYS74_18075 [Planctomycetota bacterium]